MSKEIDKVWYACYGSNLRKERFLCYIRGGTPSGAMTNFTGCTDKNEPEKSGSIRIPHELYFSKESPTWNGGGICFLNPVKDEMANTLGRRYLISSEQFIDLVRQELQYEGNISIDFDKLIREGSYDCLNKGRYGMLLYLGDLEGRPVVTFTSKTYLKDEINRPDKAYILTIAKGLKEVYDFDDEEIKNYLLDKTGISGNISELELLEILGKEN